MKLARSSKLHTGYDIEEVSELIQENDKVELLHLYYWPINDPGEEAALEVLSVRAKRMC